MNLRGKATIGLALCAIAAATRAVVADARDPRIWFGLAALCALAAVVLRPRGSKTGVAVSEPVTATMTAETAPHRNATVYIGSGEEDRRYTAKMGTPRSPAYEPRTY